jgi:hypothetical protein
VSLSKVKNWRVPAVTTAAACVLVVSGCAGIGDAGSDVPSSGPIHATAPAISGPAILGTATDTTGRVGAGATVTVMVVLRSSEQAWRDAKAIFSLGLGCLDTQGCTPPRASGIVAADGHFAVAVPHGLTDKDGLAVTVEAQRGSDSRVSTTLLLPASAVSGATVSVPLAADPAVLRVSANRARLQPPSVTGASTEGGTVQMDQVDTTGDGQPVSGDSETDVSGGFDVRLIEDGKAMLVSHQAGSVNGLTAEYSSSLVITGHAIPGSRGAGCVVEDSHGAALPQHPCGLTNGALDQAWQPQDDPACAGGPCPGTLQSDHRDVTVLLPKPIGATLLVVRGCAFTCKVQVSVDGTHFGPFSGPPQDSTGNEYSESLPGLPVAAVRVETATGGFFDSLQQVSVFA